MNLQQGAGKELIAIRTQKLLNIGGPDVPPPYSGEYLIRPYPHKTIFQKRPAAAAD